MPPTHTDEGIVAAQRIRELHPGVAVLVLSQYAEFRRPCLHSVEDCDEVLLCFLRGEPPWTRLARVGDPVVVAHNDEPLGPRRERPARAVAHLVQEERHAEAETRGCLVCLGAALLECRLLVENDVFLEVRGKLPLVCRVGLGDVDEREVRATVEALEEALDVARPATKRRSGDATEDEQQRLVANERGELDRLEVVRAAYDDGGEGVSGLKRFGVAVEEQAGNHCVALGAGSEALDVGAILRVDDSGERAVFGSGVHVASIRARRATNPGGYGAPIP